MSEFPLLYIQNWMRVLQLNIDYSGTGADRCARELFEDLPKHGIATEIWVSGRKLGTPPQARRIQSGWERLLTPLEAFPDLMDWRHRGSIAALRSISKQRFDLVHIHLIHSGWISIRAVRELTDRFPCVWTLHDEWAPNLGLTCNLTGMISPGEVKRLSRGPIRYIPYHRYHDNFKWRRTSRFLKKWLPQPKVVICPSRYMTEFAVSAGVFANSEIIQIPNGTRMLDVPESRVGRESAKASFSIDRNKKVVLMASADLAQAHKGVGLGINAIRSALPHDEILVILLGSSSDAIARALSPIPTLRLCTADDRTLALAYRAADVTLLPSLADNFSYVALESMACETPLIAFPIGGMPELIGKNERGIMCASVDSDEMGRHLGELLRSKELIAALSQNGKDWVVRECNMETYLGRIAEAYDRALLRS